MSKNLRRYYQRSNWSVMTSRRYPGRTKHHLLPKVNGGDNSEANIALIKAELHEFVHKRFGNKSLDEIIALLIRFKQRKERHARPSN